MIRKLSTTSLLMMRPFAKRHNPGLGHQLNAIENAAEVIQSDPEGFEGLESDLLNVNQSHRNYELELKRQNEKRRQCIIKNKYFRKDPLPNLLTYAEKQHIKFLHSSDEEEWTAEKLSESFPANAEIISKIIKTNWVPLSSKRIRFHDASVFKNWERFKSGQFKTIMDAALLEHLKKFVDRKAIDMEKSHSATMELPKKQWQKPVSKEFSSIISLQSKNVNNKDLNSLVGSNLKAKEIGRYNIDSETHLLGEIKDKRPITIHQLKFKHLDQMVTEKHENTSANEMRSNNITLTSTNITSNDYIEKFISNEVIISEFDRKRYGMSITKQRICIPRKLWRKGATYRAINCYYDDDGEFLYKVPGINSI